MMLGIGAGYCLNMRYIGFKSSVFSSKKYLILPFRFLLGIVCLALIITGFNMLILRLNSFGNHELLLFIKFAAAALWVSAGAPWLFRKLRLSEHSGHSPNGETTAGLSSEPPSGAG
jgi:ABC-type nickel/cobalt efflux system permease component RcnA